jgi:hypothetical protein
MLETIFCKLVQRIENKQKEAEKWTGTICPKIRKKLDKFIEWSKPCEVLSAGNGQYRISSGELEKEYNVDLPGRTCTCRRWQISGIPCHHALAICRNDRINPESLVHKCYRIETYFQAYGYNMVPLRGRLHWEKMNGVEVNPPLFTKVMGRPKKNRKKGVEEKIKKGVKHITKHGVTMHCFVCGKADHNKKGHDKFMERLQMVQEEVVVEEGDLDDPSYVQVHIYFSNTIFSLICS